MGAVRPGRNFTYDIDQTARPGVAGRHFRQSTHVSRFGSLVVRWLGLGLLARPLQPNHLTTEPPNRQRPIAPPDGRTIIPDRLAPREEIRWPARPRRRSKPASARPAAGCLPKHS